MTAKAKTCIAVIKVNRTLYVPEITLYDLVKHEQLKK